MRVWRVRRLPLAAHGHVGVIRKDYVYPRSDSSGTGVRKRPVRDVSISVRVVAVELDHGFDSGKRIRYVHSPRNVQDERTRHDACQIELYPHIESRDVDSSDVSCPLTSTHDEGAAVQSAEPPTCSAAPRAGENLSSSGHDDSTSRRLPDSRGVVVAGERAAFYVFDMWRQAKRHAKAVERSHDRAGTAGNVGRYFFTSRVFQQALHTMCTSSAHVFHSSSALHFVGDVVVRDVS